MLRKHFISVLALALSATAAASLMAACAYDGASSLDTGSSGVGGNTQGSGGAGEPGGTGSGIEYAPLVPAEPDTGDDAGSDAPPAACAILDQNTPVVLTLSADDSSSMASPVYCRDMLSIGIEPLRYHVRTYEFLNYYRMKYPDPTPAVLGFFPELEGRSEPGMYDFQVALRSYDVKPGARRPINVTFVVDTSGSMQGPGIENARATLLAVAEVLAPGDKVSIVTWSTQNNALLSGWPVTGPNDPTFVMAAESLEAIGDSDLSSGLTAGYALAEQYRADDRMNRVVLISDGGANLATTDADIIAQAAEDGEKEGIYLVGVGTSPPLSYNDNLMNTVTERGRGAYVYIDTPEEAKKMFGPERFDETMEIAARAVTVKITLPWYFRVDKFYGEAISTSDVAPIEPQHLAPNDAMIFHQLLSACDPSVVVGNEKVHFEAIWTHPITYTAEKTEIDFTVQQMLDAQKIGLPKGRAVIAFAEALKKPSKASLQAAHDLVNVALANGADPELDEILALIEKHPQY